MPNATVNASTEASATGRRIASPRTSCTREVNPAAAILSRPLASIAPAKSTPTTRRPLPGRARAVPMATSAVPAHTSSTRSRPVNASDAIARRRQARSSPSDKTVLSRS